MRKFLVINQYTPQDATIVVCDDLELANETAKDIWGRKTSHDRKHAEVYVLAVSEEDLDDPEDWTSFNSTDYCPEAYDSKSLVTLWKVDYSVWGMNKVQVKYFRDEMEAEKFADEDYHDRPEKVEVMDYEAEELIRATM